MEMSPVAVLAWRFGTHTVMAVLLQVAAARGWLVIAGIVLLATLGMGPASRSAERFLARESVPSSQPA
jgi:hypothetical protein